MDDEQHCIDTLLWELDRHCPEVEVKHTFNDPEKAFNALKDADIDILFLDIHLQSTSGIELLERLMPVDYHVIFVTAYDEYALKAFDLAATHYLLKPVNGKRLKTAINRIDVSQPLMSKDMMDNLLDSLRKEIRGSKKVAFSVQSGVEFLDPEDIIYVEGDNNYSILHLDNNKKLVVSKTLSYTEELLTGHSFIRIHKSYLINLSHLSRYHKNDGGYVEMGNGAKLSVSRTRRMVLNELFK